MPTVKEKYGYLPTSVWEFTQKSSFRLAIGEKHGEGKRRSANCKYLPNLKYSSFNPDLAKRILEYWSNERDTILDPFAGHSTRAVATILCNRNYIGFEISPEAYNLLINNLAERPMMLGENNAIHKIILGDGCKLEAIEDNSIDMIFTCPPFWCIERYESVEGQLSDYKTYQEFLLNIKSCVRRCFAVLKKDKFIAWVVADFRKDGLKLFHKDVCDIFQESGFTLWDIVINVLHSPLAWAQIGKCEANKYTSKVHEYVIVAKKCS